MEKLKSAIPERTRRMIAESTPEDIPTTCSSLHDFFQRLPLFHQMIDDLTNTELGLCSKNREAALELKKKGNDCFFTGDYHNASNFYSQALRVAPITAVEKENNLVATLYVNRASSFHKVGRALECLRDCNRALTISPTYAKAWYRRGKANTSLQYYKDAVSDLKIAAIMEGSLSGKRQIESDLKLIVDQRKRDGYSAGCNEKNPSLDKMPQVKLQCVSTPVKGKGMISSDDIPPAALIHTEEPYAAIILKNCRDTHCHFCFNELPADTVPCINCAIPLYCTDRCLLQAAGNLLRKHLMNDIHLDILSGDLQEYFSTISSQNDSDASIDCFAEHQHECHGAHWSAVLPSDVALAGRVLVKAVKLKKNSGDATNVIENLELAHNYLVLPPDVKLELHIYSIMLLNCLRVFYDSSLLLSGDAISKVVILIAQIRVNSMAIVRVGSADLQHPLAQSECSPVGGALTTNMEQVRVGQAIYSTGSFFNHSCQPNIHAYFLSRTLLIQSTEFVIRGCPLELSYGPQVGQQDCGTRQKFLEEKYSFECQCCGCSEVNLSDLVLNAFCCVEQNCFGAVLDCSVAEYEMHKVGHLQSAHKICSVEAQLQVDNQKIDDIVRVARLLCEQTKFPLQIVPGCCLSCGSYYDLRSLHSVASEAEKYIRSMQKELVSGNVDAAAISNALRSVEVLKSTLHAYNKKIAEAEDILAQAFLLNGELQPAVDHCIASIKILKKLYGPNHIAIGNELVKLSSLQLSLGDLAALDTMNQLNAIFSRYYGPHADMIFPYLKHLKGEAHKLVSEGPQ